MNRPPRTGDLYFYHKPTHVIHHLIQYFSNGKQFHVGMITGTKDEHWYDVWEAHYDPFKGIDGTHFTRHGKRFIHDDCQLGYVFESLDKQQRDALRSALVKYTGLSYDRSDILLLALKKWLRFQIRGSERDMICSEGVQYVYKEAFGIDLTDKLVPTPVDIWQAPALINYGYKDDQLTLLDYTDLSGN